MKRGTAGKHQASTSGHAWSVGSCRWVMRRKDIAQDSKPMMQLVMCLHPVLYAAQLLCGHEVGHVPAALSHAVPVPVWTNFVHAPAALSACCPSFCVDALRLCVSMRALRFYEPQQGTIYLNGRPVSEFSRGEWAKAVAMVSQMLLCGHSWAQHMLIRVGRVP
eukprot:1137064-Pelagomonas_calceolata.AAC.1